MGIGKDIYFDIKRAKYEILRNRRKYRKQFENNIIDQKEYKDNLDKTEIYMTRQRKHISL